jgi:uncharacterized LabA/DUF88 family protein
MQRVVALIDGFNFYHPIHNHQQQRKTCLQWLNYPALLRYYLSQLPPHLTGSLEQVIFFSALAKHRNTFAPNTTQRHLTYINALKSVGVEVILGTFKKKHKTLRQLCQQSTNPNQPCVLPLITHEEKETDVRIACKLLELAVQDAFDTCLLLSADSDLIPAVETLKHLYPAKRVILVTPPSKAKVVGLERLCEYRISVGVKHLQQHQLPNTIQQANGYVLQNPWQGIASPSP